MSIKKLTIKGLRGFSEETNINFAIPDNISPGSGLTVLVGPNNSGKSTVIEAIHLLSANTDIVPVSSRNIKVNGQVFIEVEDIIGNNYSLQSTDNKGAFIQRKYNGENINFYNNFINTYVLSSKKIFHLHLVIMVLKVEKITKEIQIVLITVKIIILIIILEVGY